MTSGHRGFDFFVVALGDSVAVARRRLGAIVVATAVPGVVVAHRTRHFSIFGGGRRRVGPVFGRRVCRAGHDDKRRMKERKIFFLFGVLPTMKTQKGDRENERVRVTQESRRKQILAVERESGNDN